MKEKNGRVFFHGELGLWQWFDYPLSVDGFVWDFVGRIAGTHVDTVVLHMTWNYYSTKLKLEQYESETGSPLGLQGDHSTPASPGSLTANNWRMLENAKLFAGRKIDLVATLLAATHNAGLDFFAGIRMNDVHHAQWDWHPKFWIDHPEFRIGDHPEYRLPRVGFREPGGALKSQVDDRVPAALDFNHAEVRDYKLALIDEVARAYEVEGIELDFTRHPFFFKPGEVPAGRPKMTEFMAAVKERLQQIGKERGRPITLEVRVPPTLEACWRIGLDVRAWMAGNLVDIVTATSYWHPDFGMPVEEFVAAAKGTSCKVFAGFEPSEMPALEDAAATARMMRAAALAYWKSGVDGLHLFNSLVISHYLRQEMPFLLEIGRPKTLEYLDKHYMITRSSNYDDVAWFSYPKQLPKALEEAPRGEGQKFRLTVGDDLKKAVRLGFTPAVTLRLRLLNLTSDDQVEFKINGVPLNGGTCKSAFYPMGESKGLWQYPFMADPYFGTPGPYHWLEFPLTEGTWPSLGANEIEVVLRRRNPALSEPLVVNDVEVTIYYGREARSI